jgi:hypothetical protein
MFLAEFGGRDKMAQKVNVINSKHSQSRFRKKLRFSIINLTMKKLPKLDELGIEG